MAKTRQSKTVVLPNGNRVTVTIGHNRSGPYKTVSVRRKDGTGDSQTDQRGFWASEFRAPFDFSIPDWARGGYPATARPSQASALSQTQNASVSRGGHPRSHVSPKVYAVLAFLVILVVALIVHGIQSLTRTSYGDGRNWVLQYEYGYHFMIGKQLEVFPGCKYEYMASRGFVQTPQSIFNDSVQGAGEPGDNYAQWRKGCLSARRDHKWAPGKGYG